MLQQPDRAPEPEPAQRRGRSELKHADRLTLLPKVIRSMRDQRINFVSFTPGTSFQVGHSGGAAPERVLLYWMFAKIWGAEITGRPRWKKFFQGGKSRENFERELAVFDQSSIDDELCASFGDAIEAATGPNGGPLEDELDSCAADFNYLRGKPNSDLSGRTKPAHWRASPASGSRRGRPLGTRSGDP